MLYFVPNRDCFCQGKKYYAQKRYQMPENSGCFFSAGCQPIFSGDEKSFEFESDKYLFLNFQEKIKFAFCPLKIKGADVGVSLGEDVCLFSNNQLAYSCKNCGLTFERVSELGAFSFIFFDGKRKFVAIFKNKEFVYANYFDEINFGEKEVFVLTRLNDSLNHGRVWHLKEGKEENYLVYLDDFELNLKPQFLPAVFLDCVRAKNLNYLKHLLSESLANATSNISLFFGEIEEIYPLREDVVAVIKKDATIGIYKFEIENLKIQNIIEL